MSAGRTTGRAVWPEIVPWEPPVAGPERTRLVSLAPVGVGTPFVESLPSYLLRLAAVHWLDPGVLAELVLPPQITGASSSFYERFVDTGGSLIGIGAAAEAWSSALAQLTGRLDVRRTTLLPLAGLLGRTHLRREAAVCRRCLGETTTAAELPPGGVGEPLAWSVAAVTVCTRHRTKLEVSCPACARPLRALGWRARTGHCRGCDAWLGDLMMISAAADDDDAGPVDEWALWAAERVGAMLAQPPVAVERQRTLVVHAVEGAVLAAGSGNALARALDVSRGLVSEWRAGKVVPGLPSLLALCAMAEIDPAGLVRGELATVPAPHPPRIGATRKGVDWPAIEAALRRELESPHPRSPGEVLDALGVDRPWAARRVGALCERLRDLRRRIAVERMAARRRRVDAQVARAIAELDQAGIRRSRRALEARLPDGLQVRETAVKRRWRAEGSSERQYERSRRRHLGTDPNPAAT